MIDIDKIKSLVADFVSGTDMFLVEIKHGIANNIEVVIDSDSSVSIDKCVELSRVINDNFDRDVEDFELTVASSGIGQPVKLLRQYNKIIGKAVDIVFLNGNKLSGILTMVNETSLNVEFQEKQLLEGKKRKQLVDVSKEYSFSDIKSVILQINFK